MSKIIRGDIFKEQWDVMMHVANCYHTMGGGIAAVIAQKFPCVLEADKQTPRNESKLGTFSNAFLKHDTVFPMVFNLYAQSGIGSDGHPMHRNLRYDAFFDSLYRAFRETNMCAAACGLPSITVALPYGIGCGLAGGNWEITKKIIDEVEKIAQAAFKPRTVNVNIYKLK